MIDFKTIQVGDICEIVGEGTPGYAKLGDFVKITKVHDHEKVDVVDKNGTPASFMLSCGAARLKLNKLKDFPKKADA